MGALCSSGGHRRGRATASGTCTSRSSRGFYRTCRGTRSPASPRWCRRIQVLSSCTWNGSPEVGQSSRRKQNRPELPDFIKRSGASRVAIDSVSLLNMLFADDKERREKLFALCKQLKSTEATCIFTAEVKDDNPRSSRDGLVEYVSDGVIGLRFNERENGEVQLVIQVIKMRRIKHPRSVKPYSITDQGLEVHGDMEVF